MSLDRTWFDALVDDDGSNTVGSVWNKTQIDALLDSVDTELGFVRNFYPVEHYGLTPGIVAEGRYVYFGKLVILHLKIQFPTVTDGNSTWFDGMPVASDPYGGGLYQAQGKQAVWRIAGTQLYGYNATTGANAPLNSFSGQLVFLNGAYITTA